MSEDAKWIGNLIAESRKKHNSVTQAASDRMLKLLSTEISEHQLSAAKLTSIAKLMIADMLPVSPGEEQKE